MVVHLVRPFFWPRWQILKCAGSLRIYAPIQWHLFKIYQIKKCKSYITPSSKCCSFLCPFTVNITFAHEKELTGTLTHQYRLFSPLQLWADDCISRLWPCCTAWLTRHRCVCDQGTISWFMNHLCLCHCQNWQWQADCIYHKSWLNHQNKYCTLCRCNRTEEKGVVGDIRQRRWKQNSFQNGETEEVWLTGKFKCWLLNPCLTNYPLVLGIHDTSSQLLIHNVSTQQTVSFL